MKRQFCFIFLFLLLGSTVDAQHKKKKNQKDYQVYIGASINRYAPARVLQYETPFLTLTQISPYSQINLGLSYQKINENNWFQEFSLVKLSLVREEFQTVYKSEVDNRPKRRKYSVFDIVGRYEYGKYFGRQKKGKLNFGLSMGIEPYYSYYKPLYYNIFSQTTSHKFGFNLQFIPIVSYGISKKIILEFKLFPQLLDLYAQQTSIDNPSLTERERNQFSIGVTPFTKRLSLSLSVKYKISDDVSKKRKKRRKRRRR